jgi:hydrogenase/urease accessory protein HupE
VIELMDSPLSGIDYLSISLATGLLAAFCWQRI